jgi:uncharacterized protein
MNEMLLELRKVDPEQRTVVGICAPYDEVTYLTWDPSGERIRRGAFKRSLAHRKGAIPLLRNHDSEIKLGQSRKFTETDEGLVGEFRVNDGARGDDLLEELRNGYLDAMSVGFQTVQEQRGEANVREIVEARLVEVSMVALPAYAGAAMLAVRNAQNLDDLLAPFRNRPEVNLEPLPAIVYSRIR